jgi:SAM-dependent methyltransferase
VTVTATGPASPEPDLRALHGAIRSYYTGKVEQFGATPLGVDWSCVATQEMRFVKLLNVVEVSPGVTLNDLGCGYGALLALLDRHHAGAGIDYLGIDLSAAMVRRAQRCWRDRAGCRFVTGAACPRRADYAVASGIFNVQLDQPRALWEAFIRATLDGLAATSTRGFAVNFIAATAGTTLVDGLYATTPEPWIAHCERRLGATVELVEGYGLREFTLLARPPQPT